MPLFRSITAQLTETSYTVVTLVAITAGVLIFVMLSTTRVAETVVLAIFYSLFSGCCMMTYTSDL